MYQAFKGVVYDTIIYSISDLIHFLFLYDIQNEAALWLIQYVGL